MAYSKHLKTETQVNLFIMLLGLIGCISVLPVIPSFLGTRSDSIAMSLTAIQGITLLQSSLFVMVAVYTGHVCAPRVHLGAPLISAWINKQPVLELAKQPVLIGTLAGVLSGVILVGLNLAFTGYLPNDFVAQSAKISLPWYSRFLYGGVTEEVLLRWGLMSALTLAAFRLTQPKTASVKAYNYIIAIAVSSILFGVLHLPALFTITTHITPALISYIIVGNSVFGIIAGLLYWKKGLESAMMSHMVAHGVLLLAAQFT